MSGRALIALSDRAGVAVKRAGLLVGWAVVAVLGLGALMGVIPANPEGGTLSVVEGPLQIGLLVVLAVGLLVAIRWPAPGATTVVIGGLGLAVLSAIEHAPWVAVVVAGSCAASGFLLWLGWQRAESLTAIAVLATVTSLVLATAWVGGSAVYGHFFGPTHPTSATPALDDPDIEWAWAGAVTDVGARIVVRPRDDVGRIGVVLTGAAGDTVEVDPVEVVDGVASLEVVDLVPSTDYEYRFRLPDERLSGWTGHVRTFPAPGDEHTVRLAFASCARTGSSGMVYDAIRAADADLFVITGDLHYQNIATDDPGAFAAAYDRVLTAPAQAALYRSTPIAYVWDDHDYGGNDADGSSASWPAARSSYERTVPSYDLVDDRTINQAFSVGDVRIVVLDTRSAREPGVTLLGSSQLAWLQAELVASAATHRLVIVTTPTPWIAAADPASDTWGGFAAERGVIADTIAANAIDNVLIVGGDAHMVAIDDGSNSDYSSSGGAAVPVLQAAALDRPGGVKGGPYSEGTFPGGGQFGLVTIASDGTTTTVTLEGRNYLGETLVTYRYELPS